MTDLDRLEELLAKAPDINHARITLKREIEVILPKAVVDDALKAITELRQLREIVREAEEAGQLILEWRDGPPPPPWNEEWFIAETIYGDRVCLTALPEEWAYDFKTADDTYMVAKNIKRWMQFPDSEYIAPAPCTTRSRR